MFRVETENPINLRQHLERLSCENQFAQIGQIDGIKLVAKTGNNAGDCSSFALGLSGRALAREAIAIQAYPEADEPHAGDYVLYYRRGKPFASHIGILQENGKVVSQWGNGHKYEHSPYLVPASYGDIIKIVRRVISK